MKAEHEFKRFVLDLLQENTTLSETDLNEALEVPQNMEQGDLALPCFRWSKAQKKAPHQIAQTFYDQIKDAADEIEAIYKVEVQGPYLNFYARNAWLASQTLTKIFAQGESYGHVQHEDAPVCVLEFSSPNIAKPFSIGHLRSTNLGACLSRIFEARGWKVIKINHLGDWGTQFGKVMLAYRLWGSAEKLDEQPMKTLYQLYVRFHEEEAKDPSLTDQARDWFRRLEEGDAEAKELWRWFRDLSLREIEAIYGKLGVSFDHHWGESFYIEFLPRLFSELESLKLSEKSDEATIINLKDHDLSVAVIKKKDESSLYISRDLAAAIYRYEQLHFDQMIYVVGAPQQLHFKQLFKILSLMGNKWVSQCEHVDFGHVAFGDQAMSTRKGNVIFLEDVLAEAQQRAIKILEEKNLDMSQKEIIARAVGLGAVLFADVSARRIKDVKFSWEEILNFDGETGPYLQYTLVRTKSLLRRVEGELNLSENLQLLASTDEAALLRLLEAFPRIIEKAEREREPFVVGEYAVELAQSFNRFYAKHRVLDASEDLAAARVSLVVGIQKVLESSLSLLGLPILEEM